MPSSSFEAAADLIICMRMLATPACLMVYVIPVLVLAARARKPFYFAVLNFRAWPEIQAAGDNAKAAVAFVKIYDWEIREMQAKD